MIQFHVVSTYVMLLCLRSRSDDSGRSSSFRRPLPIDPRGVGGGVNSGEVSLEGWIHTSKQTKKIHLFLLFLCSEIVFMFLIIYVDFVFPTFVSDAFA